MATIREIKSLSLKDGKADNMTDKEAIEWLKIWHKNFHCEVARAKAAYEAANKNCLAEGVMLGGSRRRRRGTQRRSQSPPESPQGQPQMPPASAVPSPAAVEQVEASGDLYDMLAVAIITAGAAGVGALGMAMGVDEGLTAILGLGDLSQCSAEARLAQKLEAGFLTFDTVDYCVNAEVRADKMLVAAPVALASLCAFFGITNAPAIMAGGVKSGQKAISSWLRSKFSGKEATTTPPDALVNAAALGVDASRAARTASRNSPPRDRAAAVQQAVQSVVSPQQSSPRTAQAGPLANTQTQLSPPAPPSPQSPNYSATTPPEQPVMSPHTPTPEGEDEDDISALGMDSPVTAALQTASEVEVDSESEGDESDESTASRRSTRSRSRRSVRRSSRRRTPTRSGGKKKKKATRKVHHKRKPRKPKKQTRKNKPKHKTRKAHHKKHKGRKGKKSRKH